MKHFARLEGGPFDGDQGSWGDKALPTCLWAMACPEGPYCQVGGVHWTDDPIRGMNNGGERYDYDRMENGSPAVAVYIFADLDLTGGPRRREREDVPV